MTTEKTTVISTQDLSVDISRHALRLSYLAGKLAGVNLATEALDRFVLYDDPSVALQKARDIVARELKIVTGEIEDMKK